MCSSKDPCVQGSAWTEARSWFQSIASSHWPGPKTSVGRYLQSFKGSKPRCSLLNYIHVTLRHIYIYIIWIAACAFLEAETQFDHMRLRNYRGFHQLFFSLLDWARLRLLVTKKSLAPTAIKQKKGCFQVPWKMVELRGCKSTMVHIQPGWLGCLRAEPSHEHLYAVDLTPISRTNCM